MISAGGGGGVNLFIVDADRQPPQAGAGRLNATLRAYVDPKQEFAQIFNEGWRNQRDYLYVPNQHGSDWPRMRQMYSALLPYVRHRADRHRVVPLPPHQGVHLPAAGDEMAREVGADRACGAGDQQ